jgi:hypothetical protein
MVGGKDEASAQLPSKISHRNRMTPSDNELSLA